MRKKIFIIHGRGVVNGLGTEGGGDLDTVASNTFYAVWTRGLIKKDEGREAEYGRDYEFDFVNYQAGLSHLKIHKGCDLYLPDFPVDALSPRLKLLLLESEEDVKIRNRAFQVLDAFKQNIYSHASLIDNDLKELYNSLINKVRSYYSDYSKYEVALLSELFSFFHCMISLIPLMSEKTKISANSLVLQFKSFFSGINFRLLRDEMGELLGNRIFENLKDKYIKKEPAPVKAFNDLKKEHLSSSFKVKISDNLIVMLIESCNFLRKIKLFISKYGKVLDRTDIRDLTGILSSSAELVNKEMTRFILFINELKIKDPKAIKIFNVFKGNLKNCMRVFALLKNIKDTGKPNKIVLMLIEEESLSGVENVDITFSKIKGDVNFISNGKKLKGSKVDLKTNKNGGCSISVGGSTSRPYYISITFNELNYLVYTNIENKEDLRLIEEGSDEYHVSDQKDTGEILSEEEEASIEKGESPTRALKVSLQMIEKDFKILKKNDVRMIRIDDHHPWTKEILDLLNKLKDQGYIMENITMSGPNRLAKEEQPKSVQKCGTDLIYESLIKDTGLDNPGYRRLCTLAHLQDLHIKEDNLAIEISKLIGSGYSKIKMAEMLSRVRSKQDIKNIMARNQWTRLVQEYEDSLADVLPRIEKNIIKVSLLKKPEGNDHSKGLGLFGLLKPFLFLYRNREDLVKRLYALNKKNRVDIFMVLSPFTDKKAGEVKINVASAINYLRRSYRMDYIFYCYGSMLMTTRRVGKTGAPINLSSLVAYIGTKADGGHPEAATGKPSSNPSFPEELFEKVNDSNFYEYVFYITQKVAAFTDRDIFDIREVRIRQYEQIIESSLHELEGSLLYLNFKTIQSSDSRKEPKKILLVKNTGGLNISTAINYLAYRKKYEMDYLFFTRGSERLIVRNINDPSQSIDINKCVKLIGSENDKGFLKAGIAFPRNNKEFPADDFKYINTFNICEYAFYLKERMKGYSGLKFINIEEVQQKNSSPVHKNRLLQIQNTLWRTVINYKGRNYNISYAFSPVTASFKRKDAFSITTALAYIRKISDPDIIFYSDGFNIVVRKDEKCELPLSEILPLFSNIKKIPCEYYCTMVAGDLKDFIKYFDGYLDPLNFPLLVEYINSRITLKESVQTISSRMHELSVSNISAVNEKLLEKAYRSKVEIFFYFKGLKRNLISIMIPYYDPKEGRITFNEVMAYFKSRIKDFHYLLFYQGRDTITINNVDDKECIIDLSKLTSSIGGPDDHGLRSTGYIHMQRNKKFSKERFAKINYLNFSEFVDHIKERISEELDLQNKE